MKQATKIKIIGVAYRTDLPRLGHSIAPNGASVLTFCPEGPLKVIGTITTELGVIPVELVQKTYPRWCYEVTVPANMGDVVEVVVTPADHLGYFPPLRYSPLVIKERS
jgi:hypothetical protein